MTGFWSEWGTDWLIEEPFWGRLWAAVPRMLTTEVPSIALQPAQAYGVQLAIHPGWADSQVEVALRAWLRHELIHLLLGHPSRVNAYAFRWLIDIASDLEVNALLPVGQRPPDAICSADFPEPSLPETATADVYYHMLLDIWRSHLDGQALTPSGSLLSRLLAKGHPALQRHRYWSEWNAELRYWQLAWQKEALYQLSTAEAGFSPTLWDAIHYSNVPGRMHWKQLMGMFASTIGRTRMTHTLHRPSKRYGIRPGLRIRTHKRLWVAVDTSGSVGTKDLELFFREIDHIWRTGADLTILECDQVIHRRYPYRGQMPHKVSGRGGTRFDPVLEAAAKERPDGLIFFTDGLAAAPLKPCGVPILWMITPDGIKPGDVRWEQLPGKVERLR